MPPRPRITTISLAPCLGGLRPHATASGLYFRVPTPTAQATFTTTAKVGTATASTEEPHHGSPQPAPPSRWVSDVRARVGKCIGFGCNQAQVQQAAGILATLASEWRELSAGSEGFLTGGRKGLEDQQVVWGEMDSFVSGSSFLHVFLFFKFVFQPTYEFGEVGYSWGKHWFYSLGLILSHRLIGDISGPSLSL